MEEPKEILSQIITAEKEASVLMKEAHAIMAETKSGKRDVVTEYDRRVQGLLMNCLSAAVPGAAFFCEENSVHDDLFAENVFIIDPIDGTMNFVHGYNYSCISVAYASRGEVRTAAVYNPYMDEVFSAIRGKGAWLNGKSIHVDNSPLSACVCVCGTAPYNPALTDLTFRRMRLAYDAALDIRRSGSAELDLCSVASGRMGLYFEESISLWDYAAGGLIVTEAGGCICQTSGMPMELRGGITSVMAGGSQAVNDFLKLLAENEKS